MNKYKIYQKQYRENHKEYFKEYQKEYQRKNKQILKKKQKRYRLKNKEKIKINRKEWVKNHKYYQHYHGAKKRCNNINNKDYKNYGGRGIRFLMTLTDFKYLWYRDKAYNMKQASIDRIDNNGNYELSNCKFIEFTENNRKDKCKLTKSQVKTVRRLYKKGNITQKQLGLKYNVTREAIKNIINRKTWKHI